MAEIAQKKETYQCSICKLHYEDKELMEQCEAWCKSNDSCDYAIGKQSIEAKAASKS